jgi:hypothetical protein
MKHAAILILAAAMACRAREGPGGAAASPTAAPVAAAPASAPTPSPDRLVGRWLRSDADYTIEIAGVGPDGKLDARYFNPGPIRVSRAETATQGGKLLMALELTDKNYPGNFYALMYDPGSDSLSGVYNHLGLNQQYEVTFSRVSAAP